MGIEGKVLVKLLIDEKGIVRDAKVVKQAGHGFDENAREALKKSRFVPARTSDGKAVVCTIIWTTTFDLTTQ
jgi:TonB family protein